ncbi:MAG: hypothetical protein RIS94_2862 [Pseudomonadota bacterium]|jgi:acetyl esterase/lipase
MMMRTLLTLFALMLALPASAQGPRAPSRLPGPLPTHADIGYVIAAHPNDPRKLDLYLPPADGRAHPLVIFTHGSAWLANNGRDDAQVLAAELNPRGYAVVGVAVRTSGQARFPGQVYDIKAAIRWLRAHAAQYALEGGRIGIVGESSGGWTAAMAALTGDVPQLEGSLGNGRQSSAVQAAVAFYPPTDFAAMDDWALEPCRPAERNPFGRAACHGAATSPESRLVGCPLAKCPAQVQAANPIRYISRADPPMLIVHGGADALVPHAQGEALFHALARGCRTASFISLPVAGHGNWSGMLTEPRLGYGATIQSTTEDCGATVPRPVTMGWGVLIEFLDAHLKR